MKLWQRWKQTALHNKALVLSSLIMAFGTVFYSGAAVVQIWMLHNSSVAAEKQTKSLIDAANVQASAANSFASTASAIDKDISDAVKKLNLQANELKESAKAGEMLAKETGTANSNVIDADRPWMGAYVTINKFGVNEKPAFTFVFTNSGKRPAQIDLSAIRFSPFPAFPSDPEKLYIFDTTPSKNFVVPGQAVIAAQTANSPLPPDEMTLLEQGNLVYFAFGEVEYTDIRTNQHHWTHVCIYYFPSKKTETDNGFRNCAKYNNAN